MVSRILAQNLTAGKVWMNCAWLGEQQLTTVMLEFWDNVGLKQFTNVDSSYSLSPPFFLVDALRIWFERLLKLLVMNCLTDVSLMKESG